MVGSFDLNQAIKELRGQLARMDRSRAEFVKAIQALEALATSERSEQVASKPATKRSKRRRRVHRSSNGSGPRGIDAVLRVLQESGPLTIREITDEIQRRGWIREDARNPYAATRVAVARLADRDSNVVQGDRYKWTYRTDEADKGTGAEEPAGR